MVLGFYRLVQFDKFGGFLSKVSAWSMTLLPFEERKEERERKRQCVE